MLQKELEQIHESQTDAIVFTKGIDAARNILPRCRFDKEKCRKEFLVLKATKKSGTTVMDAGLAVLSITLQVMEQLPLECLPLEPASSEAKIYLRKNGGA